MHLVLERPLAMSSLRAGEIGAHHGGIHQVLHHHRGRRLLVLEVHGGLDLFELRLHPPARAVDAAQLLVARAPHVGEDVEVVATSDVADHLDPEPIVRKAQLFAWTPALHPITHLAARIALHAEHQTQPTIAPPLEQLAAEVSTVHHDDGPRRQAVEQVHGVHALVHSWPEAVAMHLLRLQVHQGAEQPQGALGAIKLWLVTIAPEGLPHVELGPVQSQNKAPRGAMAAMVQMLEDVELRVAHRSKHVA
mmetsp:Transcript_10180/g.32167  ORF Transcript_10180/g.32167 Transcript_10180/m.32167 type:complete len:249 (+) Transcript_10180:672-1418(+)